MLLQTSGLCKAFSGVQALREVSFDLRAGEVHALVGENGAGKSTLIKIITGAYQPDAGTLEINECAIVQNNPQRAKDAGVAVIYQQPALFASLTVSENLALGLESGGLWRRLNWRSRHQRAEELLQRVGADINPNALVSQLTMPQQQLVEIARAIGANARILILDEPTATLSKREADHLLQLIAELRQQGVGIIYISHRFDEIFALADRVTILRDGQVVATRSMTDLDRQTMIQLMVGRELSTVYPAATTKPGETLLEVRQLNEAATGLRDLNFKLHAGEILGFAGLVGAGRTELATLLFGLRQPDSGEIRLRGESLRINSPAAAIAHGIAYLPEDRRQHGVIPAMPITANVSLAVLPEISMNGFLQPANELQLAEKFARQLSVKTASLHAPVSTLSGGNQQKVALSRWLAARPQVMILDEPTQGVDVGAKAEIHQLMRELAAQGLSIMLISSELPEILGLSDRIVVMRQGTIVAELSKAEASQEKIMTLAL